MDDFITIEDKKKWFNSFMNCNPEDYDWGKDGITKLWKMYPLKVVYWFFPEYINWKDNARDFINAIPMQAYYYGYSTKKYYNSDCTNVYKTKQYKYVIYFNEWFPQVKDEIPYKLIWDLLVKKCWMWFSTWWDPNKFNWKVGTFDLLRHIPSNKFKIWWDPKKFDWRNEIDYDFVIELIKKDYEWNHDKDNNPKLNRSERRYLNTFYRRKRIVYELFANYKDYMHIWFDVDLCYPLLLDNEYTINGLCLINNLTITKQFKLDGLYIKCDDFELFLKRLPYYYKSNNLDIILSDVLSNNMNYEFDKEEIHLILEKVTNIDIKIWATIKKYVLSYYDSTIQYLLFEKFNSKYWFNMDRFIWEDISDDMIIDIFFDNNIPKDILINNPNILNNFPQKVFNKIDINILIKYLDITILIDILDNESFIAILNTIEFDLEVNDILKTNWSLIMDKYNITKNDIICNNINKIKVYLLDDLDLLNNDIIYYIINKPILSYDEIMNLKFNINDYLINNLNVLNGAFIKSYLKNINSIFENYIEYLDPYAIEYNCSTKIIMDNFDLLIKYEKINTKCASELIYNYCINDNQLDILYDNNIIDSELINRHIRYICRNDNISVTTILKYIKNINMYKLLVFRYLDCINELSKEKYMECYNSIKDEDDKYELLEKTMASSCRYDTDKIRNYYFEGIQDLVNKLYFNPNFLNLNTEIIKKYISTLNVLPDISKELIILCIKNNNPIIVICTIYKNLNNKEFIDKLSNCMQHVIYEINDIYVDEYRISLYKIIKAMFESKIRINMLDSNHIRKSPDVMKYLIKNFPMYFDLYKYPEDMHYIESEIYLLIKYIDNFEWWKNYSETFRIFGYNIFENLVSHKINEFDQWWDDNKTNWDDNSVINLLKSNCYMYSDIWEPYYILKQI